MIKMLSHYYNSYKGVILFSGLKYLEIVIMAFTTFYMAQKIGAVEMGKAVPVLLYITYSSYLSLGINQVVIKNFSKKKSEKIKFNFLKINLQFMLLVAVIGFFGAWFFVDSHFYLTTALICAATLLKSYFMSYFRVINRIQILNKNNIIFSLLLFIFTLTFVVTWYDYLLFWSLSIWISLLLYFFDARKLVGKVIHQFFQSIDVQTLKNTLSDGIKLAMLGGVTTLLLTLDRLLISNLTLDLNLIGSYQLADYIGMAVYMILTTILFYYYPSLIQKLRDDNLFRRKYLKRTYVYFFSIIPFSTIVYFSIVVIQLFIFKNYTNLSEYVFLNLLIKLIVIGGSLFSMVYISLDKEAVFIKSSIPVILIAFLCIIASLLINSLSLTTIVLIIAVLVTLDVIFKFFLIRYYLSK